MKNFTNNFKQFTSRLSARWLIMALMILVGTSSAWAANKYTDNYIFLDLSGFPSWADGGAVMKVGMCNWDNLGNGHQMSTFVMTKVPGENYIYYADISSSLSIDRYGVKFSRHNSDGTEWDSFFSAYNSGNCGKPNDWKSGTIYNLQDIYCISAPTFGEVEVGQSATSSGEYLYAGVTTIPTISNNEAEFQYVAGSSSITTNGLSTITVKFTPSSAGDKTGTLKFGSYLTTSLSGTGKVSCATCCTEYYVAGESSLCGEDWDPDADIMDCLNDEWSITFNDKEADTYTFKITDGTWNNSWNSFDNTKGNVTCKDDGSNDHNIQFTTTSKGNITISFDGSKAWVTFEESCITPDFSVSLSKSEVAVGCTEVTASIEIEGNDSPTVTWSSSNPSVATINSSGVITINGAGETTITATTIEADGFCEGVEKTATLTVKSPITTVTLEHANSDGTLKAETPTYCVGDVVYFKLTHDGSPFSEYDWTTYPGSGLAGYCSNGSGLYHFTLTGSGTIGISLRNEANVDGEGNPTWVESNLLAFNTHPEPTAPYISIDPASGVLCEGNTATITVTNPSTDCAYKLVEEGSKAGFTDYESGDLKYSVGSVGKYYVAAQHIACRANEYTSNQVEINQIISTSASISIEPANPETTPWEPVTITVNPEEGYVYELSYTDNNLAGVAGVIIKQNGDSYTYYIPRPNSWGTGDSNPVPTPINYGIKAQLKVDGEASQCDLNADTATIQLKDEDNEDCPQ